MSLISARRLRLFWAFLALAPLLVLPTLALASPPDPSWIPGIYDDADSDDVVVLVSSSPGGIAIAFGPDLRPFARLIGRLGDPAGQTVLAAPALALHSRAPPAQ